MKDFRLRFTWENWGLGVGDHLMHAMVISSWQSMHPGEPVHLCIPTPNGECLLNWPGAIYVKEEEAVDYPCAWHLAPFGDLSVMFKHFGLDFHTKRLRYWITEGERARAEAAWGDINPRRYNRVLVQLSGGLPVKRYKYWVDVIRTLRAAGCNIIALDHAHTLSSGIVPIYHGNDLRTALSFAATADVFVGYDSGPFYAALGAGVPAVGLFPCATPEQLFEPILDAVYIARRCHEDPNKVSPVVLATDVLEILRGAQREDKSYFTGHFADNNEGTKQMLLPAIDDAIPSADTKQFASLYTALALATQTKVIVETGVLYGYSTAYLAHAARLTGAKVYAIDLFEHTTKDEVRKSLDALGCGDEVELIQGEAKEELRKLRDDGTLADCKLVVLDDWHSYDQVMAELTLVWNALPECAIVLSHDACSEDDKDVRFAFMDWQKMTRCDVIWLPGSRGVAMAQKRACPPPLLPGSAQ